MGENTKIEWADATFNPWVGCSKIGPGCDHCYAESYAKRTGQDVWGLGKPRRRTTISNWSQPIKWNNAAQVKGERLRVFTASLADIFDNEVPQEWRDDLFALIRATPHLDWLIVTKRIGNAKKMLPADWGDGYPNVWLLITVVNQEEADRDIPKLLATPARLRGLSCEPLLGQIDLSGYLCALDCGDGLDWIIAGGESGHGARPAHPDWLRKLRDDCAAAGTAFFFKQWGEWAPHSPSSGGDLGGDVRAGRVRIVHPSGRTDVEISAASGGRNTEPGSRYMALVGKKAAGAMLDGREHKAFPK